MSAVRMSEAQYKLFKQAVKPRAKGTPRVRRDRAAMPENQIEAQICEFLRLRCWICTKSHVGTYTPYRVLMQLQEKRITLEQATRNIVRIGVKGEADWRAERPLVVGKHIHAASVAVPHQLFYFETKRPGAKPTPEQISWLERKRLTGTPAEWFSDFDVFQEWYVRMFGGK